MICYVVRGAVTQREKTNSALTNNEITMSLLSTDNNSTIQEALLQLTYIVI